MSLQSFFLTSGSLLALVLASSVQAEPVADNACTVDAAECIMITQSADAEAEREPGIAANTATVTLDGTQTTILAYEDLAQSGDGNTADFAITGDQNTFLFAQSGNSLLAITVDGNANTVGLFELGGVADRLASLTLDIAGDANAVDILSQRAAIAADLLEIDILGMNNILEVKFEDYARILTSIMGDGNTAKIAQNTATMDSGSSAVTLLIEGAASHANIVNILQNGPRQTVYASLSGSENLLSLVQDGPYGMDNRINVALSGISNNAAITQSGEALVGRLTLTGDDSRDNAVIIRQTGMHSSAALSLNGSVNTLNMTQGGNDDIFTEGFDNRMDVKLSGTGNTASIAQRWDMNEAKIDLEGDRNGLVVEQRMFSVVSVVQRGSYNWINLNIASDQHASLDVRGNSNTINVDLDRTMARYYDGDPTRVMIISGNDNDVIQRVYGMDTGRGKVVITGDENRYNMTERYADSFGLPDMLRETVDILGNENNLTFDSFHDFWGADLALDAKIRGNANVAIMRDSAGIKADIEGDRNQLIFDFLQSSDYDFRVVGDDNKLDVKFSDLKNSSTWIMGDDNQLTVTGLSPRQFGTEITGSSNMIGFSDTAGISAMFAYQTVVTGAQNVLTVGSAHEGAYDPADYDGSVMLLGDRNTVSVTHGLASFDVNLVGSDHTFDVTYDPALNAYTHAVTAVGSGSAVFTSENGVVTITRSGV